MISEVILIPKIYARLQEIASNFSKFSGGGPPDPLAALARLRRSVRGFAPLPASLSKIVPKFLDPPLISNSEEKATEKIESILIDSQHMFLVLFRSHQGVDDQRIACRSHD